MTEPIVQLIDVSVAMMSRQDALWGLFISVHLAIFGGIAYVERPFTRAEKSFGFIAYLGLAFLHYLMISTGQNFPLAVYDDLAALGVELDGADAPATFRYFIDRSEAFGDWVFPMTIGVHLVAAILVLLCLVYDKPVKELVRGS
jgi:hypothetical protein